MATIEKSSDYGFVVTLDSDPRYRISIGTNEDGSVDFFTEITYEEYPSGRAAGLATRILPLTVYAVTSAGDFLIKQYGHGCQFVNNKKCDTPLAQTWTAPHRLDR